MKRFVYTTVVASALLLHANEAKAAWMICCPCGIAYTSSSSDGPWEPAGGCAGGPWAIEYAYADSEDGGEGQGVIKSARYGLSEAVLEQIDTEELPQVEDPTPRSIGEWVELILQGWLRG